MFYNLKKVIGFTSIGLFSSFFLMLSSFIFIRSSSPEESGIYFFYVTISGFIANIALFGNGTFFNKSMSDVSKSEAFKLALFMRYFFISSILISLLISHLFIEKTNLLLFYFIFIEVGVFKVFRERIYSSYARFFKATHIYLLVQATYVMCRFVVILCYYFGNIDYKNLFFFLFLSSIPSILLTFDFFSRIFKKKKTSYIEYLKNGAPFFFATFFTMGFDYAPIFSLSLFCDSSQSIGLFSSSYKIISIILLGLGILCQSLLPYLRAVYNDNGVTKTILSGIKIILFLFLLYLPINYILYFNSNYIINLIIGVNYLSAASVLKFQSIGVWGSIVCFISFTILQSIDKESIVIFVISTSALLNFSLCIYFVKLGAEGVAIAMSISLLFCAALSITVLFKEYRNYIKNNV